MWKIVEYCSLTALAFSLIPLLYIIVKNPKEKYRYSKYLACLSFLALLLLFISC